jgi:hypothetical protein
VTTYVGYDRFLEHDMDAVILADYLNEHAPFGIKALEAGKHVMSECTCNSTLPEGGAICRSVERTYVPDWPEHADLARQAGHGGGDFWTIFEFANAIRSGTPPFLDVYRGVAMSSVGILAWKSALADGAPFEVPDFRDEADRKKAETDNSSPFPSHTAAGAPRLPSSIARAVEPTEEDCAAARRVWQSIGYDRQ